MKVPPSLPAFERDWIDQADCFRSQRALAAQRVYSCSRLRAMESHLADALEREQDVLAVAASGSLGRLEAHGASDGDLIVVLSDDALDDHRRASAAMDRVWKAIDSFDLERPQPSGIYHRPTSLAELCHRAPRGVVAERMDVFGKRIQLLLDSQPLYGRPAYANLLQAILTWYSAAPLAVAGDSAWSYLIGDAVRYFRSYTARTRWNFPRDEGGWLTLQLKLRYSRLVMCAGLLLLLAEASRHCDGNSPWLASHLYLTPLERIAWCYRAAGAGSDDQHGLEKIAVTYDSFLASMLDHRFRRELAARAPRDASEVREASRWPPFVRLYANGQELKSELLRFFVAYAHRWPTCLLVDALF